MLLNKALFQQIAKQASNSPRLRMHYDLRDSEDENGQRMLNVLLPGSKSAIHRHCDTTEVVVCIHGSAIERFYDDNGNETECILMTAGGDNPGVVVEKGKYHTLEATSEQGVVIEVKAGKYDPITSEDYLP